jgi:hypothetical protein
MKLSKIFFLPGMLLFTCVLMLSNLGCKKVSNMSPTPQGANQNTNPVTQPDTDVYLSGNVANKASIWKNGILSYTTGIVGQDYTYTFSMTVNGSNLYIAGIAFDPLNGPYKTPVYWNQNRQLTELSFPPVYGASAHGMTILGSDVYVAGIAANNHSGTPGDAAYWKNNVLTVLADSADYYNSNAWNIAVSGTDVYVCGDIDLNNNGGEKAVYWKNGVLHELTDASVFAQATKIYIQNNDVYVMYNQVKTKGGPVQAHYAKNGVDVQLPTDLGIGYGTDMLINGNDTYITGYTGHPDSLLGTHTEAILWKNNALQKLYDSGTSNNAYAGAVAISGNNVYIAGEAGGILGYWKNGSFVANITTFGTTTTTSINGIGILTPTTP